MNIVRDKIRWRGLGIVLMMAGVIWISCPVYAQSVYKADPDGAKAFFEKRNYFAAIKVYQLLLKKDPDNVEYNQMIARCYMLSNSIKAKAIPHLEFLIKKEKIPDDTWLDLGRAYHFSNRFDDAIEQYNKYKSLTNDKKGQALANRYIEQALNGKELMKRPLNVEFEPSNKGLNSEFPDYYPFVVPDESALYFTSRRKSPTAVRQEFDGLYPSDIFMATNEGGKMAKAKSVGNLINTQLDEQIVDISDDGLTMLFYIDHIDVFGDIWISRRLTPDARWLKPQPLPDNINAGLETSASIYYDQFTESEILLIASSRPDKEDNRNYGETDIYIAKKLPTGEWSEPKNLGPNINTPYKEDAPHLSPDGKTLYFSSEGHSSMGGFDLFKSQWDDASKTWSAPRNLGFPINSAADERNISFTSEGRIAYISTLREGGEGDLDVYRLILKDVDAKETIFKGHITSADTTLKIRSARIDVIDKATGDIFGTYIPNGESCYFVIALPPGKWTVMVEADGYKTHVEAVNISEEVLKFSPEITKNIKLIKE